MLGFLKNKAREPVMPVGLRERLTDDEKVLLFADKVGVVTHLRGHLPGVFSSSSSARSRGAFVLTTTQVIATFVTRSHPHVMVVDSQWDRARGPALVTFGARGVHIDIALHGVDPAFSGSMSLSYKRTLTDEMLVQLPATQLRSSVDRRSVYLLAGVRPRS